MHTIQVIITTVVDGESRSWSADTTSVENPHRLANGLVGSLTSQAMSDLRHAAFDHDEASRRNER